VRQIYCRLRNYLDAPEAQKSSWTHPIELLGDVGHTESHFGPFGDSVSVGAR
jgi:hypothetical protein